MTDKSNKSILDSQMITEINSKGEHVLDLVKSKGFYKKLTNYEPELSDGKVTYGEGYPITAFEKFLGYYDKVMNIAHAPSISMTTDFSLAKCVCKYSKKGRDVFFLDGETNETYTKRMEKALTAFKSITGIGGSFELSINRIKKYEKAKGLGESAAVASAASRAIISNVFGSEASKDNSFVSRFARLASGSGTRSAINGISVWVSYPKIKEEDCRGYGPILKGDLYFATFPDFHNIKTMDAHGVASSSPFYPIWIKDKFDRIAKILNSDTNIENLIKQGQEDTFYLRSLLISGGIIVDTEKSVKLINNVKEFQRDGRSVYLTADTGPSITVLSPSKKELNNFVSQQSYIAIHGKRPPDVNYSMGKSELKKAEELFKQS